MALGVEQQEPRLMRQVCGGKSRGPEMSGGVNSEQKEKKGRRSQQRVSEANLARDDPQRDLEAKMGHFVS